MSHNPQLVGMETGGATGEEVSGRLREWCEQRAGDAELRRALSAAAAHAQRATRKYDKVCDIRAKEFPSQNGLFHSYDKKIVYATCQLRLCSIELVIFIARAGLLLFIEKNYCTYCFSRH